MKRAVLEIGNYMRQHEAGVAELRRRIDQEVYADPDTFPRNFEVIGHRLFGVMQLAEGLNEPETAARIARSGLPELVGVPSESLGTLDILAERVVTSFVEHPYFIAEIYSGEV